MKTKGDAQLKAHFMNNNCNAIIVSNNHCSLNYRVNKAKNEPILNRETKLHVSLLQNKKNKENQRKVTIKRVKMF